VIGWFGGDDVEALISCKWLELVTCAVVELSQIVSVWVTSTSSAWCSSGSLRTGDVSLDRGSDCSGSSSNDELSVPSSGSMRSSAAFSSVGV
jgi:hypothetical protein